MKPGSGKYSISLMVTRNQSWVRRHPKFTGILISILLLVIFLLILDRLIPQFQGEQKPKPPRLTNRAIVLRENHPGLDIVIDPKKYIDKTDGLEYKEFPFRLDNNGFLLPHNTHEDPEHLIVFMGGSTVECMYVDENLRFPRLVELDLGKKLEKTVNVLNAGASGNHTVHSINLLINKIVPLKPDFVVISHAINDYISLSYDHTYWIENTNRSLLFDINDHIPPTPTYTFSRHLKGLVRTTYPNIYQSIFNIIQKTSTTSTTQNDVDEWYNKRNEILSRDLADMKRQFTGSLDTIIDVCNNFNITPVLMTQANRFKSEPDSVIFEWLDKTLATGISYSEFKSGYDEFNNIIRKISQERKIALIDLDKLMPKEKKYIYDTVHYNKEGSRIASEIISDKLVKIITQNKLLKE